MKKGKIAGILIVSGLMLSLTVGYIASAAAGDVNDPLISLSYLNSTVLPQLKAELKTDMATIKSEIVNSLKNEISSLVQSEVSEQTYTGFKAVEVQRGDTILGHEGTEIILRSGTAVSICPGENGLTDTTAGLDLTDGKNIEKNHVYIVPREDGRGMKITIEGFIMVKGGYDIVPES